MHFSWKILFYTVTVVDRHGGKLSCAHTTDESRHSCSRFVCYTYLCMRMYAFLPSTTSDQVLKNLYTREGFFFIFHKKSPISIVSTMTNDVFLFREPKTRRTAHKPQHTYLYIYIIYT